MKTFAKPLMIAAALTSAAAPALAAAPAKANPAAALSVAKSARAGAAAQHDARLGAGTSTITFGIIGAIVILAVVLIATNDTPTSV